MRKLSSKKTVVTTEVERYEVDPSIPIRVVRSIIDGNEGQFRLEGLGPHKSRPVIVRPEFWDYIKKDNPFHGDYKIWDPYSKRGVDTLEEVEQAFVNGNVLYSLASSHMIFGLNGDPIPVVLTLDYCGTILSNEYLDLDKALVMLKEHPWVLNKSALKIEGIPHYNAEEDRNRTITVKLLPDAATYKKLYKRAVKEKKESFSVLMKDWFGSQIYHLTDPIGLFKCLNPRGKAKLMETRKRVKANA